MNLELKQRGLFPKGGGRVEAQIKKLNNPLKSIIVEDAGKCSQVNAKIIYTGPDSEKVNFYILNILSVCTP